MKAAIVETPGVLNVREVPDPKPGVYDSICRNLYGATCSGTDLHIIHGRFPGRVDYPTVLGHETVGRVVDVGPRVRHLQVGDLVTRSGTNSLSEPGLSSTWGGFAEYGIVTDHWAMKDDGLDDVMWKSHVAQQIVPPDVEPAMATMLITWRETLSYLKRMGVSHGATVLLMGSGGVGLSFAAHCMHRGARTIAMTGNLARGKLALAAGVTSFFDYSDSDLIPAIATSIPEGFDFIVDTLGRKGLLDMVLPMLRPGGMVATYGIDEIREVTVTPTVASGTFTYYSGGYNEAEVHEEVIALLREGVLDGRIWLNIDQPFALDDINLAFDAVKNRQLVKALVQLGD